MIARYATLLRPPGPGAVPCDGLIQCGYTEGYTPSRHHAWGWADYNRELTPEEVRHYDLEKLYATNCFEGGKTTMTTADFVRSLWENDPNGSHDEPMDLETARIDLAHFAADGFDLPEDITPESYMEAWNDLVNA